MTSLTSLVKGSKLCLPKQAEDRNNPNVFTELIEGKENPCIIVLAQVSFSSSVCNTFWVGSLLVFWSFSCNLQILPSLVAQRKPLAFYPVNHLFSTQISSQQFFQPQSTVYRLDSKTLATFQLMYIQFLSGWSEQKLSVRCMLLSPNDP